MSPSTPSLSRELMFLILQYFEEQEYKELVHTLERVTGIFFNMKYFEDRVLAGDWGEVEKYLSGFTKIEDSVHSAMIYFEIRRFKYLEALDRPDRTVALEILVKDLKIFSVSHGVLYRELTQLITIDDFRTRLTKLLSWYKDANSARSLFFSELKKLIEAHPFLREKLVFPALEAERLRVLINQSLNWQHTHCKNPRPDAKIVTLYTDHTCSPPKRARVRLPAPVTLPVAEVSKPSIHAPPGAHHVPPASAALAGNANANALAWWMANFNPPSPVQLAAVAALPLCVIPSQASVLKHPKTPPTSFGMNDYQVAKSEQPMKRLRSAQSVDEVTYPAQHASWSLDDVPTSVFCTIHKGSNVMSMDFHPIHWRLLAVGCDSGEITLWEVGMKDKLVTKPFSIWDLASCTFQFKAVVVKDSTISVSQIAWSPDGSFIGVAFTKHLVHLFAYQEPIDLHQHLEIDAHVGAVNDLAFSHLNNQLCVVTCGDDKLVKVWDLVGGNVCNFEGHEASVFTICPYQKDNIQVITTYMPPPPASTFLAFHPKDNNIIAVGAEDATTIIYSAKMKKVITKLRGHKKRITGLAFSSSISTLVSSGEDAQLLFWKTDTWEKRTSVVVQLPDGKVCVGDTQVQFHSDQLHLLVCHEMQLAVYDTSEFQCIRQWFPQDALSWPITCAAYCCNSALVYATFADGSIGVFYADSLRLKCRITPSICTSSASSKSQTVYPAVIAAHPQEATRLAVGLSDGSITVSELPEEEEEWGVPCVDDTTEKRRTSYIILHQQF